MKLAEVLVYADIGQLHQIVKHYGYECDPHSKNDLVTTLMTGMRHQQTIRTEIEQQSSITLHFLLLVFLDKREAFTLEDLLAKAMIAQMEGEGESKKEAARKMVAHALRSGWIFPAKGRLQGQFIIPEDLRELYLQNWIKHLTVYEQSTQPLAYRDEGMALLDDTLVFLRFLEKEAVPLTADGGMYRRYQTQLLSFLSVKEEPLLPQKWRFGYGLHFDLYPDRFSLLYDFCYYKKWIEEDGKQVSLTGEGTQVLTEGLSEADYQECIRFWFRLYKRPIPNLPAMVQVIALLTAKSWYSQEKLCQILLPWVKTFYYDAPLQILTNRILKMMVHAGLLRVGEDRDGEWLYQSTEACQHWLKNYNGFVDTTILMK
ncbi:hypothetical protein [Brevibacillus daliensis]|uniref:hypothetical protein n=1 Tax=Brevibacillus daliensis TaxID=2892995 RepID=UPI001E44EC17|nr:hypothetical protein [Brevibacillus daliensis]